MLVPVPCSMTRTIGIASVAHSHDRCSVQSNDSSPSQRSGISNVLRALSPRPTCRGVVEVASLRYPRCYPNVRGRPYTGLLTFGIHLIAITPHLMPDHQGLAHNCLSFISANHPSGIFWAIWSFSDRRLCCLPAEASPLWSMALLYVL